MGDRVRIFISVDDDERPDFSQFREIMNSHLCTSMDSPERNFYLYDDAKISDFIRDLLFQCSIYDYHEQKKRLKYFFESVMLNSHPKKIRRVYEALPSEYKNDFSPIVPVLNVLEEVGDCSKFPRNEIKLVQFLYNYETFKNKNEIIRNVIFCIIRKVLGISKQK